MPVRPIARLARSVRASPFVHRAPVLARRAASSGEHKKPGSDLPWVLGSAVVFLPLGAWVSFRGDDHDAHSHPGNASAKATGTDQHGNTGASAGHVDESQGDTSYKKSDEDQESPHTSASNSGTPKKELSDNTEDVKNQYAQGTRPDPVSEAQQTENKQSGAGPTSESTEEKKEKDDKSEKNDEKPAEKEESSDDKDKSQGDEPSAQDIKDSLSRAEKTAVPRAAMDEEAHGHGNQADSDKK